MPFVKELLKGLYLYLLYRRSNEQKIKYLRKQGVRIGKDCVINTLNFSTEPYLVEIGNHVAISSETNFITHDLAGPWCYSEELNGVIYGRIIIGNNVFIGHRSTILANTHIGDNCIIGAGSVVRGKFPANSVLLGNPAQITSSTKSELLFCKNYPGYLKTNNLNLKQTIKLLKESFKIE